MKKLTLLCMAAHRDATLEALRDLGVLHLSPRQPPKGEDLEEARAHLAHVHRALECLPQHGAHAAPSGRAAEEVVKDIWDFIHEKKRLTEERDALLQERVRVVPLGAFDPAAIRKLQEKGITVGLFKVSTKSPFPDREDAVIHELSRDKNNIWFAVIGRGGVEVEAEPVRLPEASLEELDRRIAEGETALAANEARLSKHAGDHPAVAAWHARAEEQVRFIEARAGMGAAPAVAYLGGFCPEDTVETVREAAARNGWGLVVEEPAPDDPVPTLIRNPRWVRLIKPMFDFMGIAPGYDEVDISACFLLFFSLFFGMIVGDAGYGLLFLVLTLAGRRKLRRVSPQIVPLLLVMSVCTIVWGLLTGIFFGMGRLPAVLATARIDWLTDNKNIMFLCFLIGAVHLTLAHGWNAFRIRNTPQALAQVGWICNTWAMFFVTCAMVLGHPFPPFLAPLFIVGVVLIAVFMTPFAALKKEAFNHVMLPLNLISNFVDIISYVRLFAVGLATYAVGNAFNGMAVGGGIDGVLSGLVAAVVLFLGHTLNIVMATMGVLVHGIRLNTLEFSGHLGMQWTGIRYNPFARSRKEEESGNPGAPS